MERTFTWFPKLTRVVAKLPAEQAGAFAVAVAEYGTNGAEPDFGDPIMAAVFEGVREDIDNSVAARNSNKGGRPSKRERGNGGSCKRETSETPVSEDSEVSETCETPVSGSCETQETPVSGFSETCETCETPVSEVSGNEKPPLREVSKNENPPYINQTIPSQANTSQTIPSQANVGRARQRAGERREPFSPPTKGEVEDFAKAEGLDINASRFVDFYASKGWMVGGSPMADWRAAARRWTEGPSASEPASGERPKPRRCGCGGMIAKNHQTGKWECGSCFAVYGEP